MVSVLRWVFAIALVMAIPSARAAQTAASDDELIRSTSLEKLTTYCQAFLQMVRQNNRVVGAQQGYDAGLCYGFVTSMLDVINIDELSLPSKIGVRLCVPFGIDSSTATEIVAKFLDEHPELRSQAGYPLVLRAFANTFPSK
jgi:hypothetical protein